MSIKLKIAVAASACAVLCMSAAAVLLWPEKAPQNELLVGLQSVDGEQYYYNAAGMQQYGWHTIDGKRYYFDFTTGAAARGWFTDVVGDTYYFSTDGWALTGEVEVDGQTYTFDEDGKLIIEQTSQAGHAWLLEDGKYYYVNDAGNFLYGLQEIGSGLYYFDETGARVHGWRTIENRHYYFSASTGSAVRGWMTIDGGTYYFGDEGYVLTGKQTIDGKAYTFDDNGRLVQTAASTPVRQPLVNPHPAQPQPDAPAVTVSYKLETAEDGSLALLGSDGSKPSGIVTMGNKRYAAEEGKVLTGVFSLNGKVYQGHSTEGYLLSGWAEDPDAAGDMRYYSTTGEALKSVQQVEGAYYFFDTDTGVRTNGLIMADGKLYYFAGADDRAVSGWHTVNDEVVRPLTARFALRNETTSQETTSTARTYYFSSSDFTALTGLHYIPDVNGSLHWYAFSIDGVRLNGWNKFETGWYLFDGEDDSALVNQWVTPPAIEGEVPEGAKGYVNEKGVLATGLTAVGENEDLYYFDIAGQMQTGWVSILGNKYYFDPEASGAAARSAWKFDGDNKLYLGSDSIAYTGLQTVNGEKYFFSASGAMQTGMQNIDDERFYFEETTGAAAKNTWKTVDGLTYYFGETGSAAKGLFSVAGNKYYTDAATGVRQSGWQTINGKCYLFEGEEQSAVVGEYEKDGEWYLFGADGAAKIGVQKIGDAYYYYDPQTYMRGTGRKTYDGHHYFFDETTGQAKTGWFTDAAMGGVFWFDENGRAATGVVEIGGREYEFDTDGRRLPSRNEADNWHKENGKTYYIGEGGTYVTGLHMVEDALYYFNPVTSAMETGWKTIEGQRYYFSAENGKAVTGWYTNGTSDYYFGADGVAYTGVRNVEDSNEPELNGKYWFGALGEKQTGVLNDGTNRYFFDPENNGKAHSGWYPAIEAEEDEAVYYYSPDTFAAQTGMQVINGKLYLFSENGVRQSGWYKDENNLKYAFFGENNSAIQNDFYTDEEDNTYYLTGDGYALVGLKRTEKDGKLYYFDINGVRQTGFVRMPNGVAYYFDDATGAAVTGWKEVEEDRYYFHETEHFALTGQHDMEGGVTHLFDDDGRYISSRATEAHSWKWEGDQYYYKDSMGDHFTGLTQVDGYWYFFNNKGAAQSGWIEAEGTDGKQHRYYFGSDFKAVTGWLVDTDGERYYLSDTDLWALVGVHTINNREYHFNEDGTLKEGYEPPEHFNKWMQMEDGWCYYNSDGELATGLTQIDEKWYYFSDTGLKLTGWQKDGAERYYFDTEDATETGGAACTGWQQIDGVWYVFNAENGQQLTGMHTHDMGNGTVQKHYYDPETGESPIGWAEVRGYTRYFYADGHMAIGWQTLEETVGKETVPHEYYFFENGLFATGVLKLDEDGQLYSFNQSGQRINGWNQDASGYRYYFVDDSPVSGWQQIDGRYYYFDETEDAFGRQKIGWQYRYVEDGTTHRFYYDDNGNLPEEGWQTVLDVERYVFKDGHIAVGWQLFDDELYYFSNMGVLYTGEQKIDGVTYPFDDETGALQPGTYTATDGTHYYFGLNGAARGWVERDGIFYFYHEDTGAQQLGWQTRSQNGEQVRSYFLPNGTAVTGWWEHEGARYHFSDYAVQTMGWATIEDETYYFIPAAGKMAVGAVTIDGTPYSFGADGTLKQGWNTDAEGNRYYFAEDGVYKGWQQIDGRWYYLDENTGVQQTGWQTRTDENGKYEYFYFTDGSLPQAGWNASLDGSKRYVLADGQLAQGFVKLEKNRYFFDRYGVAQTGWQQIDERWYCFDADGVQQLGWQTRTLNSGYTAQYYYLADGTLPAEGWHDKLDKERRYVMADGELARGWMSIGDYKYYFQSGGIPVTNDVITIGGEEYGFDKEGRNVEKPTFTQVRYNVSWSMSQKGVYVDATASDLLEDDTLMYSFDGGVTWQADNSKQFPDGTTLAPGTIQIKDSIGNIAEYDTEIKLDSPMLYTPQHGIDVSSHQGYIDWAKVKADGTVDFAVIRALTWSREAGYYVIDPMFEYNVRSAKANGIQVGAYLYSYAFSDEEIAEEVLFFMNSPEVKRLIADGIYFDLPVFIDYEDPLIEINTAKQTISQRTNTLAYGMSLIESQSNGLFRAGVYMSRSWATAMADGAHLQSLGYDLWLAHWGIAAHGWSPTPSMWQYDNGDNTNNVAGISTRVDKNYLYYNYSDKIDGGSSGVSGGVSTPTDPIETYNLTVLNQYGQKVTLPARDVLAQIVMNEVGGFSLEVYKAQAVAAHSYIRYQTAQGYIPQVGLKNPTDPTIYTAVDAVLNEILTYNGQYALTPYYAYSNGYTNDATFWNANNNFPYLKTVTASQDSVKQAVSITVSKEVVQQRLEAIYGEGFTNGVDPAQWISITSRNSGGYVTGLLLCNKRVPASIEYFYQTTLPFTDNGQRIYPVRSPDFDVQYDGTNFIFTSRGYGHCIGMSQTAASGMAKEGKTYEEILAHFYPGTVITEVL